MKDYWIISDTHFGHQNIITYCKRPFYSYLEMDTALIDNWNRVVKKGDYVYHLGDFFMEEPRSEKEANYRDYILASLNGRITLILGNHDKVNYLAKTGRFHDIVMWKPWNVSKNNPPFLMTHVPVHKDSILWEAREGFNLHGHTHNFGSPKGPYKCACVELINYTPKNIEELYD